MIALALAVGVAPSPAGGAPTLAPDDGPRFAWVDVAPAVPARRVRPADDPDGARARVADALERTSGRSRARWLTRSAAVALADSDALWVGILDEVDDQWFRGRYLEIDSSGPDALRDRALEQLEHAAAFPGPHRGEALLSAGLIRRERGELVRARLHLGAAIDEGGRAGAIAALQLGETESDSGRVPEALAAYRLAARRGDRAMRAYAHYRLGWCHASLGLWDQAIDALLRAERTAEDPALAEAARLDAERFGAALPPPTGAGKMGAATRAGSPSR